MVFLILLLISIVVNLESIKVPIPNYDVESVNGVLRRRIPSWMIEQFDVIQVLSSDDNKNQLPENGEAKIRFDESSRRSVYATTPVDALFAINSYLRSECYTQISWSNSSFGNECKLQKPMSTKNFKSKKIRYFGNMCTFSYSFVWWKWEEWEEFIDWLALNGFNSVLMPIGQELIWRDVFMSFGVSRKQLDDYFTSQAYLAWHRMGNLKSYGVAISDDQMEKDFELAKRITSRFVELGIVPILPTFAGFVPDSMAKLFPDSKFNRMPCWNNFTSEYSCLLTVSPSDQLFGKIANRFLKEQKMRFGDISHIYSADPFNEITPKSSKFDAKYLKQMAQSIGGSCRKFDKNCIWLLQSWQFSYDKWPNWAIKTFLSAVPIGQLIILDLYAEIEPSWSSTNSFYGHYFVWCLLHNFGGTREIRGNLKQIDKGYQLGIMKNSKNMIGGGLTMEAIDQNYIIYQFMIDRMWTDNIISINNWLKIYSESRYSTKSELAHKLWSLLAQTFYDEPIRTHRFSVFLYHRPGFEKRIQYWFSVEKVFPLLKAIIGQLQNMIGRNALFVEDSYDILRSILQYEVGNEAILTLGEAYLLDDRDQVANSCDSLMAMFDKIDELANRDLVSWTSAAKRLAGSSEERGLFTISSRDLLTTWGEQGENLDYAHREWRGLISEYYSKRWEYFCEWILENDSFNKTEFDSKIFKYVEKPFLLSF
ncbi:unnamed protein product [Caenorhabditis angaria]|uniref:Alpha-N-acetylglucosaminidase n=1 Tax=Caenorhabditis angaria TaxID=860376 RepID=A0A9P1MYS0_9PELO|nr:unnamed protein product [Caenorhabditis angaria]